jgi:hypothetical protein
MFRTIKWPLLEKADPPSGPPASDPPASDPPATPPVSDPPNWRATFAGDDGKVDPVLERFTTQHDFLKSFKETQARIRSGELLKPLPKGATPDDVKAYREQQGIPGESKGYFEALPEGLVIGADDQPIFDTFAEKMHAINAPPAFVHEAIKWYNDFQQEQTEALVEADKKHADECSQQLRDEWGSDYRVNINVTKALLSTMPAETQKRFNDARTPEGKAFLNDPEIVKWLVGLGREVNDVATIVDGGATDDKSIDARIAEIEATMGTKAYTKNEKVQAELRKLYEVREKRKARAA